MLLSRLANDVYWMSRYMERAENIARFIEVNWYLMLDLPDVEREQWGPLIQVSGDSELFKEKYGEPSRSNVMKFLMFDEDNSNSIISCVKSGRENARFVREQISTEIWEHINSFYHTVQDAAANESAIENNPQEFLSQIRNNGALLGGLAFDTMPHGEAWHFFRLGRFLERADKTSRILDVKYFIILPDADFVGSAHDVIQWAALLRSASGLEMFRKKYGRITPEEVVEFLLFDPYFPRSVQSCLNGADLSLRAISGSESGRFNNAAGKSLGQLRSELSFMECKQIIDEGLHEFIDDLQLKINQVDGDIFDTYFAILHENQDSSSPQ